LLGVFKKKTYLWLLKDTNKTKGKDHIKLVGPCHAVVLVLRQAGPGFWTPCHGLFCFQWFLERGGSSFCWYWWNSWLSIFPFFI